MIMTLTEIIFLICIDVVGWWIFGVLVTVPNKTEIPDTSTSCKKQKFYVFECPFLP